MKISSRVKSSRIGKSNPNRNRRRSASRLCCRPRCLETCLVTCLVRKTAWSSPPFSQDAVVVRRIPPMSASTQKDSTPSTMVEAGVFLRAGKGRI